jgi:hypothetical protein
LATVFCKRFVKVIENIDIIKMDPQLKKKRKPNFSHDEVEALVLNYSKHAVPLNSKFGATMNKKKKDLLWEKITNAVNAVGCTVRTTDEVKAKWKEHKKNSKAKGRYTQWDIFFFSG